MFFKLFLCQERLCFVIHRASVLLSSAFLYKRTVPYCATIVFAINSEIGFAELTQKFFIFLLSLHLFLVKNLTSVAILLITF